MFRFHFIVLVCVFVSEAARLPPDIGRCRVNDPNLNQCLTANVEVAIRRFKNGAPKLGIPAFEPLSVPKLVMSRGIGAVNLKQSMKNVRIYGLTDSKITKYEAKLNEDYIYTESVTRRLELLADYNMNGRILVLPVMGHGTCNITLINSRLTHDLIGETYWKKGKKYFRLFNYRVTIVPDRVYFHFANLFAGDETLGREINKVLNDNWASVFADARAGYEKTFGAIFKGLVR